MDEACEVHFWGEAEDCETSLGNMWSPVCKHCGAVKLEVDRRARSRAEVDRRLAQAAEIKTNIPPAGVVVHPFQTEIFTDT